MDVEINTYWRMTMFHSLLIQKTSPLSFSFSKDIFQQYISLKHNMFWLMPCSRVISNNIIVISNNSIIFQPFIYFIDVFIGQFSQYGNFGEMKIWNRTHGLVYGDINVSYPMYWYVPIYQTMCSVPYFHLSKIAVLGKLTNKYINEINKRLKNNTIVGYHNNIVGYHTWTGHEPKHVMFKRNILLEDVLWKAEW
jgi:hypothetical protein